MSNMHIARAKTIDTAKRADLANVRTAIRAFHLDKGRMPHNYRCISSCVVDPERITLAIEDTQHPDNPQTESGKAYRASMLELVQGGYLPKVPESQGGAGYVYYDYGPGSLAGAVIGTDLAQSPATDTGEAGTCRPFQSSSLGNFTACKFDDEGRPIGSCDSGGNGGGGSNFCTATESSNYCLCNRY